MKSMGKEKSIRAMGTEKCRDWSELPADACSMVLKKLSITDFALAKTVSIRATGTEKCRDWSELPADACSMVLKKLSITDFARAKTVCSSWYLASKSTSPREIPWLIVYQDTYWELFNSEEERFYKTQNLGRFADCRALATCGSWVLVLDKELYFYIFNPFTLEIIHLPPLESNRSTKFWRRGGNYSFDLKFSTGIGRNVIVNSAVLWVDEKTKDYLVVWGYKELQWGHYLCFCRKREKEWFEIPQSNDMKLRAYVDMAYKDKKLYIYTRSGYIRILDFSLGGLPIDIPNNPYAERPFWPVYYHLVVESGIRLTTSGDVLIIHRFKKYGTTRFVIYKMSNTTEYWDKVSSMQLEESMLWVLSESIAQYWERVHYLEEEEALIWDCSVTLPTKGVSGINKDSIYYCLSSKSSSTRDIGAYELPTQHKISAYEIPQQNIQPILHRYFFFGDARWFVPCLAATQ